jgi:4-carboxymuconolactone decarboxylase
MINDENYQRGIALLRQMVGDDRVAAARQAFAEVSPDFERYVLGFLAGELWQRPGLDLKTRSLITIAAVTALGRTRALRLNIEMALQNGATKQEVIEVLLHMAGYAGFPACWDALGVAKDVFEEGGRGREEG